MMLSDVCLVCLSVAYIGPKSRTERPRKTKIGTEVAHVTRTPLSRSVVKVTGAGPIVAASRLQLVVNIFVQHACIRFTSSLTVYPLHDICR